MKVHHGMLKITLGIKSFSFLVKSLETVNTELIYHSSQLRGIDKRLTPNPWTTQMDNPKTEYNKKNAI